MIRAFDPRQEYERHAGEIDAAIRRALSSGHVILGPEVEAFETEFAAFVGAGEAVGVKSGTDALIIALRALEIGPGDEVITVANTAVPTIAAIRAAGAVPRFVDVEPQTLLIDLDQLDSSIGPAARCLMPVHLYGNPVDMRRLMQIARSHGLSVIADCAQAHGARIFDRHVGTIADIGCFSFYPTKNLGAFGDAGICTTNDVRLAAKMRRIRMYGFDGDRIAHCEGLCSRLDELQAAILRVKLLHFNESQGVRLRLAAHYARLLATSEYHLPVTSASGRHAFHQYVVRTACREIVIDELRRAGIGYGIHYAVPIHFMPAYAWLGYERGDLPVTEAAAEQVLSLPLHGGLTEQDIEHVAGTLISALPVGA
jgi:dTDP-4-amino-4,6-dideoxygalactose transaminase